MKLTKLSQTTLAVLLGIAAAPVVAMAQPCLDGSSVRATLTYVAESVMPGAGATFAYRRVHLSLDHSTDFSDGNRHTEVSAYFRFNLGGIALCVKGGLLNGHSTKLIGVDSHRESTAYLTGLSAATRLYHNGQWDIHAGASTELWHNESKSVSEVDDAETTLSGNEFASSAFVTVSSGRIRVFLRILGGTGSPVLAPKTQMGLEIPI
jgi:hypothetical protein